MSFKERPPTEDWNHPGRTGKMTCRRLILHENMDRSRAHPLNMLVMPGGTWTSESYLLKSGLGIRQIVGCENDAQIEKMAAKTAMGLRVSWRGNGTMFRLIGDAVENVIARPAGEVCLPGLDLIWLDYLGGYSNLAERALAALAANPKLITRGIARHGHASLYITINCDQKEDSRRRQELLDWGQQTPGTEIPDADYTDDIFDMHLRSRGLHGKVSAWMRLASLKARQSCALYYRDDSHVMLFAGWEISAGTAEATPLPALMPAFLTRPDRTEETVEWMQWARAHGILAEPATAEELRDVVIAEILAAAPPEERKTLRKAAHCIWGESILGKPPKTVAQATEPTGMRPPTKPDTGSRSYRLAQAILWALGILANKPTESARLLAEINAPGVIGTGRLNPGDNLGAWALANLTIGGYLVPCKNPKKEPRELTGKGKKLIKSMKANQLPPTESLPSLIRMGRL